MNAWRTRLASATLLLLLVAAGIRLAYMLLMPLMPALLLLGSLAAIYLFIVRQAR